MRMRRWFLWSAVLAGLCCAPARADTLLFRQGYTGPDAVTRTESHAFTAPEPSPNLGVLGAVQVREGSLALTIKDSQGQTHFNGTYGPGDSTIVQVMGALPAGEGRLEVAAQGFKGRWQLTLDEVPPRSLFRRLMPSGILMMLVAAAFTIAWRKKAHPAWRWFAAGAAVWTVGVAAKILWAVGLNSPILAWLDSRFSNVGYLVAGALYVGLLTGVFEIGVTWLAALRWRQMAAEPGRAVAVGLGAGAFEAFVLGAGAFALHTALAFLPAVPDKALLALGTGASGTSLLVLVGPTERILAILAHIGSRTLVLYGVATRRSIYGWCGFALLTLLDAVAGYVLLGGMVATASLWWVELAVTPFAVAGLLATVWCVRRWPRPQSEERERTVAVAETVEPGGF